MVSRQTDFEGVHIEILSHSSVKLKHDELVVYIDPFKIGDNEEKADVVFVTHEHYDHCSIEDLKKISKWDTTIVTVPGCQSKISNKMEADSITLTRPGGFGTVGTVHGDVSYKAVHAYNLDKNYHVKDNEWVGFIIGIGGLNVYHAGDTDVIPEMKDIDSDVALVPVSGTYVMTADEAVQAVRMIKPRLAIPIHYGVIVGTETDAERFAELLKGFCEVRIL